MVKKILISAGVILLIVAVFAADRAYRSWQNRNYPPAPIVIPTQMPTPTPSPIITRKTYTQAPKISIDKNKKYSAVLQTSKGAMKINLFAREAPQTVNNFIFLSREAFYDQTTFHRIVKDFMIQGGDPKGDGTGGPGYTFKNEKVSRKYLRGTIAMANAGRDTNGSQFFIIHQDYELKPDYSIFGQINPDDAQSLSVLDAIAGTPVGPGANNELSRPLEPVTVQTVKIDEL